MSQISLSTWTRLLQRFLPPWRRETSRTPDAHDEQKIRSGEAAETGTVIDDVVVGEALLGEDFLQMAATHERDAIGLHDSRLGEGLHHLKPSRVGLTAQILGDHCQCGIAGFNAVSREAGKRKCDESA